ncbi:uncharacterized protein VTP21DRAFT_2568 [Calcarisporiella thermophila]|uniref:uncharacterized protein n=1 Tax=Calcarisporiella thermophila TaxID=911321 RepID=UPI0037449335
MVTSGPERGQKDSHNEISNEIELLKKDSMISLNSDCNSNLAQNTGLVSPNGRFKVILQNTGNLVIKDSMRTMYSSYSANINGTKGPFQMVLTNIGELAIRDVTKRLLWKTVNGLDRENPPYTAKILDEGRLAIFNRHGNEVWESWPQRNNSYSLNVNSPFFSSYCQCDKCISPICLCTDPKQSNHNGTYCGAQLSTLSINLNCKPDSLYQCDGVYGSIVKEIDACTHGCRNATYGQSVCKPKPCLPDGTLVQEKNTSKRRAAPIFYIQGCKRREITYATLQCLGKSNSDIQLIVPADLAAIVLGPPMTNWDNNTLLKGSNNNRARKDLPSRADGTPLRGSAERVYWMQNCNARWIPDPSTFNCLGRPENVLQITESELNLIPRGDDLASRADDTLLRGSAEKVYWMEGCQRRWIPDLPTLQCVAGSHPNIRQISDADLFVIPGGQIPQCRAGVTFYREENIGGELNRIQGEACRYSPIDLVAHGALVMCAWSKKDGTKLLLFMTTVTSKAYDVNQQTRRAVVMRDALINNVARGSIVAEDLNPSYRVFK